MVTVRSNIKQQHPLQQQQQQQQQQEQQVPYHQLTQSPAWQGCSASQKSVHHPPPGAKQCVT